MWTENKKAIAEVNTILKQLNEEAKRKIPKAIWEELEKNAVVNTDYIKPDIPLEELDLEEETKAMLAVFSYQYFCDAEERKLWDEELAQNEREYQEALRKRYNPENLFKNTVKKEENEEPQKIEEKSLVEYKESFFRKVLKMIKKWLKIGE